MDKLETSLRNRKRLNTYQPKIHQKIGLEG